MAGERGSLNRLVAPKLSGQEKRKRTMKDDEFLNEFDEAAAAAASGVEKK